MLQRLLKRDPLVLIALIFITLVIAGPTLTYPLGRDQGEFATIGRGILNGRVPYTELWNPKPPAVFYVYALAMRLLGQTVPALRTLDFIIVPAISATLFWIGRHLSGRRMGLWAALLFPVFYFTETFWTLTQNDGIALLPMVLAVACWLHVTRHASGQLNLRPLSAPGWSLLAGLLCGYVVWFKYPFALLGVMLAAWYGGVRWRTRHDTPLRQGDTVIIVTFIAGGLLAVGAGVLYLISAGAWSEFLRSAQVTAQYTALTFNTNDFTTLMSTALQFRLQQWGLLVLLAGVGLLAIIRHRLAGTHNQPQTAFAALSPRHLLFLLLWLLAASAMMLVQAKGYDYHWLPMLPPLVLLGAAGLDWGTSQLRRIASPLPPSVPVLNVRSNTADLLPLSVHGERAGGVRFWLDCIVAVALLLVMAINIWPKAWPYLTGREEQVAYYDRFVAGPADEFNAGDSLRVANLLREQTAAGNSLYIWGFRPDVYYLSGLNPATRFIFQFPLVGSWYPPEWRQENVDTLWAALPPYVLVLEVDYMPWVTGTNEDSNTLLQGYTELNNWLIFNYERETKIGHFFVWRRKP